MTIDRFIDWLAASDASLAIQTAGWVVPAVQSIHILAIAIVMASMAMLDLRLAGMIGREQSLQAMARRFMPWLWRALAVLAVTGAVMIVGEPKRELGSDLFWLKMILLLVAVGLTAPMLAILQDQPFAKMSPARRTAIRGCALLSLACWVAIVACGRWIAYAQ